MSPIEIIAVIFVITISLSILISKIGAFICLIRGKK
jgi:hypothetical protein